MLSLNLKRGGTWSSGKPSVAACPLSAWPPLLFLANLVLHPGENPGVAFPGFLSQIPFPVGGWVRFCPCEGFARDPELLRGGETLFSRQQPERHFGKVFFGLLAPNDVHYAPQTRFPFFRYCGTCICLTKLATFALFPFCFWAPFLLCTEGLGLFISHLNLHWTCYEAAAAGMTAFM